ncbi:hypothetical protein MANES_01G264404v8 [Manihot esculenta]|uniref:Uncharacterized protein n=1 Tax=Manihot esculenta TaxID=3983 RepID=A0ACB7II23_MANES|nr:hypothetical protein MANES_01G264404v8 [Manihot esculenta]
MATCRSTTKRTPIAKSSASSTDDSSSSNRSSSAHRRSRSLSCFSRPLPPSGMTYLATRPFQEGGSSTLLGDRVSRMLLSMISLFSSSVLLIEAVLIRELMMSALGIKSVCRKEEGGPCRGTVRELVKGKLVVEMAMSGDRLIPIIIQGGDALYLLSDIKLVILRQRV